MLAISSRSPNARTLLETTASLAAELQAELFVVHVRQPPTLHYRAPATEHPVPKSELDHARKLGARVIIENLRHSIGSTLVAFAKTMGITHFVTGRSRRSLISLRWRLPLVEELQRKLPNAIVIVV